jgi:beta-galactosidase
MKYLKRLSLCLITLTIIVTNTLSAQKAQHSFLIKDGNFLLDNKPFQIISGEMHYTRIPKEYWRDRIKKAKLMGLNTISTYVFWNAHEPDRGRYDFTGNYDIESFLKIAKEEEMWVILRPSPYVCAEWEFGGYPYWLLKTKNSKVRSKDIAYFNAYTQYINMLGHKLGKYEIAKGGPVLMVQMENEYGFYGDDKEYLAMNRDAFRKAGFTGELYTCDIPSLIGKGHLDGILPAVNSSAGVAVIKDSINKYHAGKGPYFISECYPGWYHTWGQSRLPPSFVPKTEDFLKWLDSMLKNGISVNFYMFHGGTTRGFMNGANRDQGGPYSAQTCSYDYFAPLDEAGNITDKFYQFHDVIAKYAPLAKPLKKGIPKRKTIAISTIKLTEESVLFDNVKSIVSNVNPLSFEDLNQPYGYMLYSTHLKNAKGILRIEGLRDYAQIFINKKNIGVLDRRLKQDSILLNAEGEAQLDILIENLGRLNSGPYLFDNRKGIIGEVSLNAQVLKDWKMNGFPFNDLKGFVYHKSVSKTTAPVVRKGYFELSEVGDTYLDMRKWGKGHVWLNGINLGRYWDIGPIQTIYVPAVWLKKGRNEIEVFEQLKPENSIISTINYPILDELK